MKTINAAATDLRERLIEYGVDPIECSNQLQELAKKERDYFELVKDVLPRDEREQKRYSVMQLELLLSVLHSVRFR